MYGIENPPPPVPLSEGDKEGRGRGGCKLVLVKTGIARKKHNPLNPPLLRGT